MKNAERIFGLWLFWGLAFAADQTPTPAPKEPDRSAPTKLSEAVAPLKAGQWVAFEGPPKAIGYYGISWQAATAFGDAQNREFHFMAKMQGGGAASHWIYAETTHTWRSTMENLSISLKGHALPGHIWCRSFDPTTGDYYYMDATMSSNFVRYMRRSVEAGQGSKNSPWTTTSKPEFTARFGHHEEIGYHPNLFGPGDGGLVLCGGSRLSVWRKKTDTWEILMDKCLGDYRMQAGGGQYLPGFDRLILGGYGKKFMLVDAGKDGKVATEKPKIEEAPIRVFGGTSGHLKNEPWGKLIVHPNDDKRLMILGPMPDYKVWTNAKGGTAEGWVEEAYTHPFTTENVPMTGGDWGAWTCGTVSTRGVLWAMAYDGKTSKSILWKPNN